jgi:hypothetical protein
MAIQDLGLGLTAWLGGSLSCRSLPFPAITRTSFESPYNPSTFELFRLTVEYLSTNLSLIEPQTRLSNLEGLYHSTLGNGYDRTHRLLSQCSAQLSNQEAQSHKHNLALTQVGGIQYQERYC